MYCEHCGKHKNEILSVKKIRYIIENEGGFCKCNFIGKQLNKTMKSTNKLVKAYNKAFLKKIRRKNVL